MLEYIPFEKAFEMVKKETKELKPEKVPLLSSLGRVLAVDVTSKVDFPPHPTSAVDGFALPKAGKSGERFRIVGKSLTGEPPKKFRRGAIEVSTGAFIPEWALCVIMKEYVERRGNEIVLGKDCREGENVNTRASIFRRGEMLARKGTYIDAGILALLSSTNFSWVYVYPRPRVFVFATGSEISDPGEEGEIFNASAMAAIGAARECGAEVIYGGIVEDSPERISKVVRETRADVIVSTGGVSVGEVDFVMEALQEAGFEIIFWKVKQKPGKPLLFAKKGDRIFLGLPGYPASAATNAEIYLKAILRKMQGVEPFYVTRAVSMSDYTRRPRERTEFARAVLTFDRELMFEIIENQLSANPKNFAYANSLVILPPEKERVKRGEVLRVIPKWGLRRAVVFHPRREELIKSEDLF